MRFKLTHVTRSKTIVTEKMPNIAMSPEEIINQFNTKRVDEDWSFVECSPSDTGKWTHNYHRYPAKFIPQLVERLIEEYISDENAHINDPFTGCGTTIVTAISRGFKASGTDINKIANLITKVKSVPVDPEFLDKKIKQFLFKLKSLNGEQKTLFYDKVEPMIPQKHLDRIDYWFTEENKNELGKILRLTYQEDDENIRNFFLVAFSHILKNCSIWLQGSTKPTRDLKKSPAKPYDAFKRHLTKMRRGNDAFYKIIPPTVRNKVNEYLNIEIGDARKQPVPDETVDLVVTSSPYVTSYEYADLHQLSTIWLNLVDDLKEYKKEFIGTSYKGYENKRLRSSIARDIVNEMSNKSKKMAKEIEAFFIDMEEVFDESFRILKYGGRCCFVIGDTKLKGTNILNAEVFAGLIKRNGYETFKVFINKAELKLFIQEIVPKIRDYRLSPASFINIKVA